MECDSVVRIQRRRPDLDDPPAEARSMTPCDNRGQPLHALRRARQWSACSLDRIEHLGALIVALA